MALIKECACELRTHLLRQASKKATLRITTTAEFVKEGMGFACPLDI